MKTTARQIEVAIALGLDVPHDSQAMAAAQILDFVGPAIGKPGPLAPTDDQLDLAAEIRLRILSSDSRRVCGAKIQDRLDRMNKSALKALKLRPGDIVITSRTYVVDGTTYVNRREHVVSSVKPNGKIYFSSGHVGGSPGAWARSLERSERRPTPDAPLTLLDETATILEIDPNAEKIHFRLNLSKKNDDPTEIADINRQHPERKIDLP
jgi:hypothetical protein